MEQRLTSRLHREVASWQCAAAGLLVLAVAVNMAFYGACLRWEHQEELYQAAVQQAEQIRDQAVRELGALALEIAREKQTQADQAAAFQAAGAYQYIGECKITAYCCETYSHICGSGDGLTATGIPVTPGVCAVDPSVIPLGSTVIIDNQRYLAADTGGGVRGLHVDIAVPTHQEALDFGVQMADVWVVPQEQ